MSDDNLNTLVNAQIQNDSEGRFKRIELYYNGSAHRLQANDLPSSIGRDHTSCNMAVNKSVVSRIHCVVDIKDNQIGIIDKSTNGTVVKAGDANSVIIHDEFYPLVGKGCLSLGEPFSSQSTALVLFKVVMEAS